MKNIDMMIAQYTIEHLTQEKENFFREKYNHPLIETHHGLKPPFSDLVEKYLIKLGLKCRARSSSGNGCNYCIGQWPESGYNYYVPLRPERDNYLYDMLEIIKDQAKKQKTSSEKILQNIFSPLEKAQVAADSVYEKWFRDEKIWELSKDEREKSRITMEDEREKVYETTYQTSD